MSASQEESLEVVIDQLYRYWIEVAHSSDHGWFERHLSEDFVATARPFPGAAMDKREFIAAEGVLGRFSGRVIATTALRAGAGVVTGMVAHIAAEPLTEDIGPGMPPFQLLNDTLANKTVAYVGAWRFQDDRWQCFENRFLGPVEY